MVLKVEGSNPSTHPHIVDRLGAVLEHLGLSEAAFGCFFCNKADIFLFTVSFVYLQ